ncbi:4-hydroxy-tetrahydrodipicolinate synthase [Streptomyces sp. NBC_00566]|uniref:4-hydroxy-tetrahydrodipicolinate synthase n=1 Tax=Streptomyces sp. NBC_00566 TaxID=2975778 RepID=UPI002E82394C|nr:4-hydroxy-tetrahydrodipicolinate synthase [Streptomyces sp. NBC_00566]WUB89339.1 4-hydroxy-tetrahydrodipicolinate synthase [Streptomyces sp. NBC_00566]
MRHRNAPFGRTLCAMVTPFTSAGTLDLDGAARLAARLVAEGCDGLVLNGTTGESPTTTGAEKRELIAAVRCAVGDAVPLVAGVGTADTRHTIELTLAAEKAGADAALVVTPYYSRPQQAAVEAHFLQVAEASGLPLMLYDIPGRTGTRIAPSTMIRLAAHPRIVAVKDCSYDFLGTQKVLAATDLAYYAGCDEHILPLYAIGAAGCVSTIANAVPDKVAAILAAFDAGDTARAAELQSSVIPLIEAMMASDLPGTVTAKALLNTLNLPAGPVRAPLLPADAEVTADLMAALRQLTRSPTGLR